MKHSAPCPHPTAHFQFLHSNGKWLDVRDNAHLIHLAKPTVTIRACPKH